jgi:hypothetical protein
VAQRKKVVEDARIAMECALWERQRRIDEALAKGLGANPLPIFGGEDFPQGVTLTLEINGAYFTGYFDGYLFYIESREWPDGENDADSTSNDGTVTCPQKAKYSPSGTGVVNESATAPAAGDTNIAIDTVVMDTDDPEDADMVPIGSAFKIAGEVIQTFHTVIERIPESEGPTTNIVFTPALGPGTYVDNAEMDFYSSNDPEDEITEYAYRYPGWSNVGEGTDCGNANYLTSSYCLQRGFIIKTKSDRTTYSLSEMHFTDDYTWEWSGSVIHVINTANDVLDSVNDAPIPQQFWAEPGATVRIASDEPITYIVSIVPGTVLAVKAYKDLSGVRRLVDVPADYYEVRNVTYGSVQTVQIVTVKPLSSYKDEDWTDDLYVTFESSVGPDLIDILVYLIEHYTDLAYDSISFEATRIKLTPFPANFPLLDRRNAVEVLRDIAFQARCALWISNGKFYIRYLPTEPSSDDTITESDIDAEKGISVELAGTENLVTKMKVAWRMSWSPGVTDREKDKSEKTVILRHNVGRYGVQEAEYSWFIYNQPDIVYKCATFWLIRKSNTWKRVSFSALLHKLNLEAFDCVTLDFDQDYVSDGPIKAIVEEATYNSDTNLIDFRCLVPVKAGQMTKYQWFWPAGLPISLTWPPPDEIVAGDAGGDGEGMDAGGALPIGFFDSWGDGIVIVGGPNVVFRQQSDWGDRTPTDVGFVAQEVVDSTVYAPVTGGRKPRLNLKTVVLHPSKPTNSFNSHGDPSDTTVIDIHKTIVTDGTHQTHLDDVLFGIGGGKLLLRKDVGIADTTYPNGKEFDFEYSTEYGKWGAGTAFLKD